MRLTARLSLALIFSVAVLAFRNRVQIWHLYAMGAAVAAGFWMFWPTITALIDYDEFCGDHAGETVTEDAPSVREINPRDLAAKRERGEDFDLIDVREPYEHAITRIEGARLVPLGKESRGLVHGEAVVVFKEDFEHLCRVTPLRPRRSRA